ncbi:DUF397 domain-containing protein [Streptomyces sp. NPDC001709]
MSANLHWLKSSYSGDQGECVEIAPTPTTIHIRDSKTPAPTAPILKVTPTTWTAFITTLASLA